MLLGGELQGPASMGDAQPEQACLGARIRGAKGSTWVEGYFAASWRSRVTAGAKR